MRLNRYLSASGFSSRRKGETVIAEGRVKVNGVVTVDPALNVEPDKDVVTADGKLLTVETEKRVYVLNKPTGVIVSRGDTHDRKTVFDLLGPEADGVFPVGRLDADTSGVLLLSDDGDLTHRLTHPSFGVNKVYRVTIWGQVTGDHIRRLREGVELDDGITAPAVVNVLRMDEKSSILKMSIHEGRNRQIRRMIDQIGCRVNALKRISFGNITAHGIALGNYEVLGQTDIKKLRKSVSLK